MHEITRTHRREDIRGTKTYKVYTQAEADELKLDYIGWRELSEETPRGTWVLSDDGYVAELIAYKDVSKRYKSDATSGEIFLPYLRSVRKKKGGGKVEFLPQWETKTWGPINQWAQLLKREKWRSFANMYALMVINGQFDYNLLGLILHRTAKRPDLMAKKYLKHEKVQEKCMEALEKLLERKGAGKDKAIEMILKAGDFAIANKNSKDALAVGNTLARLNAMEPTKVTESREVEGDWEKFLSDGSTAKGTLTGKQTRETVRANEERDSKED